MRKVQTYLITSFRVSSSYRNTNTVQNLYCAVTLEASWSAGASLLISRLLLLIVVVVSRLALTPVLIVFKLVLLLALLAEGEVGATVGFDLDL